MTSRSRDRECDLLVVNLRCSTLTLNSKLFNSSNRILFFSIVLCVLLHCSTSAFGFAISPQQRSSSDCSNLTSPFEFATCLLSCQTKRCHNYAQMFNETFDFSVDPCDDFYQYVCGNWYKCCATRQTDIYEMVENVLANIKNNISPTQSKAIQYMADLSWEYVNEQKRTQIGMKPIRQLLEQVLGNEHEWKSFYENIPLKLSLNFINKTQYKKEFKYDNASISTFDKYWNLWKSNSKSEDIGDHHPDVEQWVDCFVEATLFDIPSRFLEIKFFGDSDYLISLNQGSSFEPDIEDEQIDSLYKQFLYFKNLISFYYDLKEDDLKMNSSLTVAMFEVLHFKLELALLFNHSTCESCKFNKINDLIEIKISQLNNNSSFDWTLLVNKFGTKMGVTSFQKAVNDSIIIREPHQEMFKSLAQLISTTPIRVLKNAMALRILRDYKTLFDGNILQGEKNPLDMLNAFGNYEYIMSPIFSRLYLDYDGKEKIQEKQAHVRQMWQNIEKTFVELLEQNNNWLTGEEKQKMLKETDEMGLQVQMPADWILDDVALDERAGFGNYTSTNSQQTFVKGNFAASFINLSRIFKAVKILKGYRHFSFDYNKPAAFFIHENRTVAITHKLLMDRSFVVDFPIGLNYGLVATTLAYQFLHSFNHWVNIPSGKFENRKNCFIPQYDQLKELNRRNSDNVGLDQCIADNGAVKLAYRLFQKQLNHLETNCNNHSRIQPPFGTQFTQEQLFFLAYAKKHCSLHDRHSYAPDDATNKLRVNTALSNFDQFSTTFNCPVGSKMNPKDKCTLW